MRHHRIPLRGGFGESSLRRRAQPFVRCYAISTSFSNARREPRSLESCLAKQASSAILLRSAYYTLSVPAPQVYHGYA